MLPIYGTFAMIACAAICCFWAGSTLTPVYSAPEAGSQEFYLSLARAEHDARIAEWQQVTAIDFDDPALLTSFRVVKGEWKIKNGQLQAVSGKADDNRVILLAPCPDGQMRIEFDAVLDARPDGRIGDLYVHLNADPATGNSARGYGLITARYFNQDTVCYKFNQPIARTEWSPMLPGQRHHVIVEWALKHLRLFIDGKVVIDAWDREKPIAPDPAKWIGLSSYDTQLTVDNFTVSIPKK